MWLAVSPEDILARGLRLWAIGFTGLNLFRSDPVSGRKNLYVLKKITGGLYESGRKWQ
jgi:hypothetical protein